MYSYGIAVMRALKVTGPKLQGMFYIKLRWVLGAATFFVVADKIRRSVPAPE